MSKDLTDAIIGMREDEALALVKEELDAGAEPIAVLEDAKAAMIELGRRFECEESFIPELIMGGEIMKAISEELKPHLKGAGTGEPRATVIMGTVQGDIHDIGKDIVVMMLDINGYEVHDLGVDIPPEQFIAAIREHGATIVGLSGLLTLSFDSMKRTVEAIAAAGLRDQVKIMVGGSPADQQVQDYTGADGWGRDVTQALHLAEEWTGGEA
jgi:5-methyltetrahydrofolate--homocysteine methyltransferase